MTDSVLYRKHVSKNGKVSYKQCSVYSDEQYLSFPKGAHLVMVDHGFTSRVYNVDPAFAPMIAAGRFAADAIAKQLVAASEIKRSTGQSTPLTESQRAAWNHLIEEFGETARQLSWPSAREVAEAGVKAMQEEADKLLTNPAVKKAWDHFMTVYSLAKDDQNNTK